MPQVNVPKSDPITKVHQIFYLWDRLQRRAVQLCVHDHDAVPEVRRRHLDPSQRHDSAVAGKTSFVEISQRLPPKVSGLAIVDGIMDVAERATGQRCLGHELIKQYNRVEIFALYHTVAETKNIWKSVDEIFLNSWNCYFYQIDKNPCYMIHYRRNEIYYYTS